MLIACGEMVERRGGWPCPETWLHLVDASMSLKHSRMSDSKHDTYELGDWDLQCGKKIPKAYIAYKTFGDPQSPAIVYPTWYSGCRLFCCVSR